MSINSTIYIALLPIEVQQEIKRELMNVHIEGQDLENAMNSRLCDLEDTINIKKYI